MNIATIPMMVHLIRPSLDLFPIRRKERFLSRAITHGFAMPTLWTPVTPIVGIIVEMTGAAWESILVWAIPLSLMGLALDIAMGVFIARRRRKLGHGESFRESAAAKEGGAGGVGGDGGKGGADGDGVGDGGDVIGVEGVGKDDGAGDGGVGDGGGVGGTTGAGGAGNMGVGDTVGSNGTVGGNAGDTGGTGNGSGAAETARPSHPAQILLAILAFNGLVLALGRTTHFGFMLNVTLAVVPFAFCWSALLRRGGVFLRLCAETLPAQVLKMKDQFFVFLSAGYMITAMQASGLGHVLNEWIRGVESAVGANLFLLMIPLIPLGLAFLGFHPAVALALTAESLNPASLGISVEITAVAMLIGASTAFIMGPLNATIGLMAGLIGQPNYRISNWNAPFTVAFLALGMIMLLIANG
jgi:hypothetical protein